MLTAIANLVEKYMLRTARFSCESRKDGDGFIYRKLLSDTESPIRERDDSSVREVSPDYIIHWIESRNTKIAVMTMILSSATASVPFLLGWLVFSAVAAAIASIPVLAISAVLIGIYLYGNSRIISLVYSLNDAKEEFFHELSGTVTALSESDYVWYIRSIDDNPDVKRYVGSRKPYYRSPVTFGKRPPACIIANVEVISLNYKGATMYFFPDQMILRCGNRYTAAAYESLCIDYAEKPFHETKFSPGDARTLGHAWLHSAKGGTPDRRYKRNPRIPVMLYGELTISVPGVFDIRLCISNCKNAHAFSTFLGKNARYHAERRYTEKKEKKKDARSEEEKGERGPGHDESYYWKEREKAKGFRAKGGKKRGGRSGAEGDYKKSENLSDLRARRILGVSPAADRAEIKKAYRVLVKRYHPDRLAAGSLSESKEAEEKLKEINRAYDDLKRRG